MRGCVIAAVLAAVASVCSSQQLDTGGLRPQEPARVIGTQPTVALPEWTGKTSIAGPEQEGQKFEFVTDGPAGAGWQHPDIVARVFLERRLPTFISRTLTLDKALPAGGKLAWIFTGPHGGFTVELASDAVHVTQRFYDSFALRERGSRLTYPAMNVEDVTVPYTGVVRAMTVELGYKMRLLVKLNGKQVVDQNCLLDLMRDQLEFTGLRTVHAVVTGSVLTQRAGKVTVRTDAAKRFQTILGFGGSPSIPSYESLSAEGKQRYWEILKEYNLLVDREYPMGTELKPDMSNLDRLSDATPHYYGDNFPNGEVSSFSYNSMSIKLGGKVIYELWALPTWATKDFTDPSGKVHKGAANVAEWARAMLTYTRMEKARTGKAPDILGIQNELSQPKEITYAMVRTLRAELDKAGFQSVKIHMPDATVTTLGAATAKLLREDPGVWSKIDYAATHEYDYQIYMNDPDAFDVRLTELRTAIGDKPFLTTELCMNSPMLQAGSYRLAFQMAQLYHKNMTVLDSVGILYCWLILDAEQPNYPASRALIAIDRTHGDMPVPSSFQLRALGAYSRRIREGMVRIGASSSNPDVLVSAYADGKGGKTLVVLNRSLQPQVLDFQRTGLTKMQVERVSLYDQNAVSEAGGRLTVAPGEILTLSNVPNSTVRHQGFK